MFASTSQFEPLLPSHARMTPLLGKAHDLSVLSTRLSSIGVPPELRGLLRSMNSYYSNRIEGQHTRPLEIEQALRHDFSADAALAAKQRLAIAHIDTEIALEARYCAPGTPGDSAASLPPLYSALVVQDIHRELFGRLAPADLITPEQEPIIAGELRNREVKVGRHVAPIHSSVPELLDRWASFYRQVPRGEMALLAAAASHQRLGWVHPFIDGNGRVMRLHTHTLLCQMGYTSGLWSPLRGFARNTDDYYRLLADADSARRGDLDGRGNLSEQALIAWIEYVLTICTDQVTFMTRLLDMDAMKGRIEACLTFESSTQKSGVRLESLRAMHYLFLSGEEISRGEFKSMLGVSERTASSALAALIKRGLLKSDSPQGKVRFGLPQHALRFLFPRLWPEAEADSQP